MTALPLSSPRPGGPVPGTQWQTDLLLPEGLRAQLQDARRRKPAGSHVHAPTAADLEHDDVTVLEDTVHCPHPLIDPYFRCRNGLGDDRRTRNLQVRSSSTSLSSPPLSATQHMGSHTEPCPLGYGRRLAAAAALAAAVTGGRPTGDADGAPGSTTVAAGIGATVTVTAGPADSRRDCRFPPGDASGPAFQS